MQPENKILAKMPLTVAALIDEALTAWADEFDGNPAIDLDVSGADLVDWFTDWRNRMRDALGIPAPVWTDEDE